MKKISSKTRNFLISGCASLLIILIALVGWWVYNSITYRNLLSDYQTALSESDYDTALILYQDNNDFNNINSTILTEAIESEDYSLVNDLLNTNLYSEEVTETIYNDTCEKILVIVDQYEAGTLEYDSACDDIEKYEALTNGSVQSRCKKSLETLSDLKDSKYAYTKGLAYLNEKDYESAAKYLTQVIKDDPNYADAQVKATEAIDQLESYTWGSIDAMISINNFDEAINQLKTLQQYRPSDELSNKIQEVQNERAEYNKQQEALKIEELKQSQLVEVTNCRAYNRGYYYTFMYGSVTVKNNSDKVVKTVDFTILMFDDSGYPVDADYKIYTDTYANSMRCEHNSCNIEPSEEYGSNWQFTLPEKCRKIKACVRSVEYIDGSIWTNDYYDYWLKDNYQSY